MPEKLLWKIGFSEIHQRGLFARSAIPAGTDIIQYIGEKISKEESERRGLEWEAQAIKNNDGRVYIFELDEHWDLDGRQEDNLARYMNHSCDGNCEAIDYEGEIWLVARCDIAEGEELLFDYGYDMEHFLDHPCKCGTDNCIGYIVREDQRKKVRKLLKNIERRTLNNNSLKNDIVRSEVQRKYEQQETFI